MTATHTISPDETLPVPFDWHGRPWTIRPTDQLQPHNGEYTIQKHGDPTPFPMNLRCLCFHLGITTPTQPIPLRTIATFLELTAKIDPTPLQDILHQANQLRLTYH